jgi:nitroreductase
LLLYIIIIAMTHIILAAENEGVGTCWIANYAPAILHNVISLEHNEVVFGITPLGYPKNDFRKAGLKNRKPLDEIVEFI